MESSGVLNYVPILIAFIVGTGFASLLIAMPKLLARKRRGKQDKLAPYECGVEPVGSARERQSVKFYMVAMVFLLFDIEAVFLVPWAVTFSSVLRDPAYQHLKFIFYGEMMLFMAILFAGLIYVWKKGILSWTR
ncbi:MAG TPA: NADH-quinone oxidoreductase subunit A [Blastocatellia bacterium]|nr:NADH-quinone oxidoreductase subunit A [Blastocatellia bacterium]